MAKPSSVRIWGETGWTGSIIENIKMMKRICWRKWGPRFPIVLRRRRLLHDAFLNDVAAAQLQIPSPETDYRWTREQRPEPQHDNRTSELRTDVRHYRILLDTKACGHCFNSVIVKYVMRISLLDLGINSRALMQNPDAIGVGEEDQTAAVVAIDRGDPGKFTSDFGISRVGKVEDPNGLGRG